MTVAAYNLLETYVDDRLSELASYVNTGHVQFIDLPERLQRRAIRNTLTVADARFGRGAIEMTELRATAASLGRSLGAVTTALELSGMTWAWKGSNMASADLSAALNSFHVQTPWESMLKVAARLRFATTDAITGLPVKLNEDLDSLALERHKCAHVASHGVTTIWLRAVPVRILRVAASFDVLASCAASKLRSGDAAYFGDVNWLTADRVRIRSVQERSRDFAEYVEGRSAAYRVDRDGNALFAAACGRSQDLEACARFDSAGQLINWTIPLVS
jgi:hypothetical protein